MKIFIKKSFVFFLILFSIKIGSAFEKVGTTSFQFLKVKSDARSAAMGEAFSAVVNSSDAVFWNPAALTKINRFDASISYLDWLLDVSHSSFSAAFKIDRIGTFGIQALMTDIGEIEVTRVDMLGFVGNNYHPGLTGEVLNPGAMVLGLSFARELTDKFAFGITTKYAREDMDVKTKTAMIFDAGLTFKTGFHSLELAAVVREFGPEIKYVDKSFPLPQTFTIGISAYLVSPEDNLLLTSKNHSFLIAYDLSHPRDYNQQHHVGLEYSLKNLLFLRCGYKINYDEEGLAFGFGINKSFFRLDYSYSDFGEYFSAVHRFTFGFQLK